MRTVEWGHKQQPTAVIVNNSSHSTIKEFFSFHRRTHFTAALSGNGTEREHRPIEIRCTIACNEQAPASARAIPLDSGSASDVRGPQYAAARG